MIQDYEKEKGSGLPDDFNYEVFRKQVISGLMQGQPLNGRIGFA
jgi:hypothetical protein